MGLRFGIQGAHGLGFARQGLGFRVLIFRIERAQGFGFRRVVR